ncbi:MAG TPA: molybdopterin cofactor-binding domain-containing protein [Acidimicrobiia bacterium]|jgi:probable selenate reductase molybdenum-binding subunit
MADKFAVVGNSLHRVDGRALVTGKPVFVDDLPKRTGLLHIFLLTSPHAHARITSIDTSRAEEVPGVALILDHRNTPDRRYTTAGQGYPEPSPYDARMFDTKLRWVGDRVAAVAADSPVTAERAARLIEVGYEVLEPVLSIDEAIAARAPVIHDEEDCLDVWDAAHNIAAHVVATSGDVNQGFAESDAVVEVTTETQYGQHAPLEPHVVSTYLDENERLVIVSSTQVPFHVRRIIGMLLDVPIHRIRVIKPRIGGGFGVKQEVLIEDLPALVTLRTGRPAQLTYTREQEFTSSRTRHPMRIRVKLGAKADGLLHALEMDVLSNTGAYGAHSLTVLSNVGSKTLPLYNKAPHIRFYGDAVYTNLPVAGAYRGYGATQGYFALETAVDRLAAELGMDPLQWRMRNHIHEGESSPIFVALGEGREGVEQTITSCALDECIRQGAERIGWAERRGRRERHGSWVHGLGMSIHMQGSGIPVIDMGSATIKMNDDGSFNLAVGATDLGTGSDTILAQIAAEVLTVPLEKIVVTSSDTDTTPFDVGAYASSTTYVSGMAVQRAADEVRSQILEVATEMLGADRSSLKMEDERVIGPGDESVRLDQVALRALYAQDQRQIAATSSFTPELSPPPFLAAFCEVAVDEDTGQVVVVRFVSAVDCGTPVNPKLAEGQVEGAIANGIGYALFEEMIFDDRGRLRTPDYARYKIPGPQDLPRLETILVESYEPTGPMGAKSVSEIGINAPIPAIANAIHDATGLWLTKTPFTAERVWRALQSR